jgi:hypothetical protein
VAERLSWGEMIHLFLVIQSAGPKANFQIAYTLGKKSPARVISFYAGVIRSHGGLIAKGAYLG